MYWKSPLKSYPIDHWCMWGRKLQLPPSSFKIACSSSNILFASSGISLPLYSRATAYTIQSYMANSYTTLLWSNSFSVLGASIRPSGRYGGRRGSSEGTSTTVGSGKFSRLVQEVSNATGTSRLIASKHENLLVIIFLLYLRFLIFRIFNIFCSSFLGRFRFFRN